MIGKQGEKNYYWTALSFSHKDYASSREFWNMQCKCGTTKIVDIYRTRKGKSKSCGCFKVEWATKKFTTHGMTRTPEYRAYINAKSRCNNPNNVSYRFYGARGIEFRIPSFEQMLEEVGPKPTKSHQLDRINNNGHYEIGNIRWCTPKENSNNRRNSGPGLH